MWGTNAGLSYEVVSPIPLSRRWLGKLVRYWAIDRLLIRGIGPSCGGEGSLPEGVLDLSRGQAFRLEKLDLLRKRGALRLDVGSQVPQNEKEETETYRRVGEERDRISDQVVSIHEGV